MKAPLSSSNSAFLSPRVQLTAFRKHANVAVADAQVRTRVKFPFGVCTVRSTVANCVARNEQMRIVRFSCEIHAVPRSDVNL